MRFETKHVIRCVKIGIFDHHPIAVHHIDSVIIPIRFTVHGDVVHIKVFTLIIGLVPTGWIFQRDVCDFDVGTFTEINILWPIGFIRPIVFQRICVDTPMNVINHVVCRDKSTTVDDSFPCNANILLVYRKNHRHPTDFFILHVIKWISRSQNRCTVIKLERHIRLQINTSCHIIS